jgi:iron complex outermembrane receptor protein
VQPERYLNIQNDQISGAEWQLSWVPGASTRVYFTQTWTSIEVDSAAGEESRFRTEHGAPRYAASITWMQNLDDGWHLSVMRQQADDVALMSISNNKWLSSMQRTDLRLAKDLRLGGKKAELGLVVQNLDSPFQDGDHKYYFNRQAMLTLKIEN